MLFPGIAVCDSSSDESPFKICTCGVDNRKVVDSHVHSLVVCSYSKFGRHKRDFCLGDLCDGEPPVPIPNTEAKTVSADDTWTARTWESRSSPRLRSLFSKN
jgi:hypothetical protein